MTTDREPLIHALETAHFAVTTALSLAVDESDRQRLQVVDERIVELLNAKLDEAEAQNDTCESGGF